MGSEQRLELVLVPLIRWILEAHWQPQPKAEEWVDNRFENFTVYQNHVGSFGKR